MNKIYLILVAVIIGIVGIGIYTFYPLFMEVPLPDVEDSFEFTLAPEIKTVVEDKILLIKELAASDDFRSVLMEADQERSHWNQEDILRFDRELQQADRTDPRYEWLLTNPGAEALKSFAEDYPEFKELFLTDNRGVNVAQTNRTSDFYQADEAWWQSAYHNGEGYPHHGLIEFDESAESEAISLYVPLYDSEQDMVVGIVKAVLSIQGITDAL